MLLSVISLKEYIGWFEPVLLWLLWHVAHLSHPCSPLKCGMSPASEHGSRVVGT